MDITFNTVSDALEEICKQHVLLGNGSDGKYHIFDSEYLQNVNNIESEIMVFQPLAFNLEGQSEAQPYKSARVEFSIFSPLIDLADYDTHAAKLETCEGIGRDVISRIRNYSNRMDPDVAVFDSFDFNTVEAFMLTLAGGNLIGWSFAFRLRSFIDISYDHSRWADE